MANSKAWFIDIKYLNGYLSASPPAKRAIGRFITLVNVLINAAVSGDNPDYPSMDIWWKTQPVTMADGMTVT